DPCGRAWLIFLRGIRAAQRWLDAERAEELWRSRDAFERLRFLGLIQNSGGAGKPGHGDEAPALLAQIDVVWIGMDIAVAKETAGLGPDHDDAVRLSERERPHEHPIDHAEDGAVRPDPEREGQDRDCGETWILDQLAKGITKIGEHGPCFVRPLLLLRSRLLGRDDLDRAGAAAQDELGAATIQGSLQRIFVCA